MTPAKTRLIATLAAIAICSFSAANALAQEQIGGAVGSLSSSPSSLTTEPASGNPAPISLTPSLQGISSAPSVTAPQAAAASAAPAAAPPPAAAAASGGSSN